MNDEILGAEEKLEIQPLTMAAAEAEWFERMRQLAEEAAVNIPYALMLPADLLGPDAKDTGVRVDRERLERWRRNTLPVKRYDGTTR